VIAAGPAVVLGSAAIVLARPFDPSSSPRAKQWAKLVLLATVILLVSSPLLAGILAVPVFIMVLLCLRVVFRSTIEPREVVASTVISTLASCIRQNLPLPMALDAAAHGRTDMSGYIMRQLSRWLVQGYSLSEAIRKGFPACPRYIQSTISATEGIGQLGPALEAIQQDMDGRTYRRRLVNPICPLYPLFLVFTLVSLLSAYFRFIWPQFEAVATEMAGHSHGGWIVLRVLGSLEDWLLWFVIFLILVWLVVIVHRWWPGRLAGERWLSGLIDMVVWHVPVYGWFIRCRSTIQAVSIIRLGLLAGSTIDKAVETAASASINHCLGRRLRRWADGIRQAKILLRPQPAIACPGQLCGPLRTGLARPYLYWRHLSPS
jgi:type II secretory pathway component PulF